MNDNESIPPETNRHAIASLIFGILTVLTFCVGLAPIPSTSIVCFPVSFLFAALALILGAISLNQIRKHNHSGHSLAWTGILVGGFVLLCVLCMLAALASFFYFSPIDAMPTPSFFNNF